MRFASVSDADDVCRAVMCKKTLSVKIMRPLSVKALICKNSCGPYQQQALIRKNYYDYD